MVNALLVNETIPVQPGIYGKITAVGVGAPSTLGIVGLVGQATTGPLGTAHTSSSRLDVDNTYGAGSRMSNLAREAAIAGAWQFVCVRPGTGGTAASRTLTDTSVTPANVGALAHPYVGTFGNSLFATIRPVAGDATRKELVVYLNGVPVQTNRFAVGVDEAGALAAATVGQPYAVFTKTATGNGTLAAITMQALNTAVGVDPTVASGDYTTALTQLSMQVWAALVSDSETPAVHASLSAFLDSEAVIGHLRMGAVGEPTTVAEATRRANASLLNSALVRYSGGGYTYPNGDGTFRNVEGYLAAAWAAGKMSTLGPGTSMTWRTIPGATTAYGVSDTASAITAGMGYFEQSFRGIRSGEGMSTLVNSALPPIWAIQLHDGWKLIEHVATAWGLLNDISNTWDEALGREPPNLRPGNTDSGRATLATMGNRTTKLYRDNGWLQSGTVIVDPNRPPTSTVAYFTFDNLKIALRAEKLVLELPFGKP